MSSKLENQAAYQASMLGLFMKQFFHPIPKIPDNISLLGKTALVTGSNGGIGLSCVRHFLELGLSHLILAVRSQERGDIAATRLRADFATATVDVWIVDNESYSSVQKFAKRCETELSRLDIAVLNAGISKTGFERCEETKNELVLQVNYLSTALLALLLLPKLAAGKDDSGNACPGRLTMVASDLALWTDIEDIPHEGILERLNKPRAKYSHPYHYGHSKLFLSMFASRLAKEVRSDQVVVNVVNPSLIMGTEAFRSWNMTWYEKIFLCILAAFFGRNVVDGGRIYVHASVVLGKESHGGFTDRIIRPYPPLMYTERGHQLEEQLWEETLREFEFAQVQNVFKRLH